MSTIVLGHNTIFMEWSSEIIVYAELMNTPLYYGCHFQVDCDLHLGAVNNLDLMKYCKSHKLVKKYY